MMDKMAFATCSIRVLMIAFITHAELEFELDTGTDALVDRIQEVQLSLLRADLPS